MKSQLKVVYRSIDDLILNGKNPRLHSERQIRQIARSIKSFGFNVPVLVDANSNVIAGHGRVLATRELKQKVIPTISIEHLSPEELRAFLIADNKICENAGWDEELLAEQFIELSAHNLDFSLDVTGFEIGEIDLMIENKAKSPTAENDPADDLHSIPSGPPIC
jgi:ParB-like chromosome segregation protein Spo0J